MADTTKRDAAPFEPPQWLLDETAAPNGLPAWLDGLDLPDDEPPSADLTPVPVSAPEDHPPPEPPVVPTPHPPSDSWSELIPLATPVRPSDSADPTDPDAESWPELRLSRSHNGTGHSKPNTDQPPPGEPEPAPRVDAAVVEPAPARTSEELARSLADIELPVSPPPPAYVMMGVTIVRDDFAGLDRLRDSFGLPTHDAVLARPAESLPPPAPVILHVPDAAPEPLVETPPTAEVPTATEAPGAVAEVDSVPLSQLKRGLAITYGMAVRNPTSDPLYEMRVEHDLPAGPRFVSATPEPEVRGMTLVWALGTLEPGATQRIQVTVQPNVPDGIPDDAVALFRLYQCVHSRTRVLKPALGVTLTVPDRASVGEAIAVTVEVRNTGSGAATDLAFVVPLPSGLVTAAGAEVVEFSTPRLAAGGSCRFDAELTASRAGNYALQLQATGAQRLRTAAHAAVTVLAPELHLRLVAPPTATAGQSFECLIDVSNLGIGSATDVRAALILPDELEFTRGGADAAYDPVGRSVAWAAGVLAPEAVRRQAITVTPRAAGAFELRAEARDRAGRAVVATKSVSIQSAFDLSADPTRSTLLRAGRMGSSRAGDEMFVLFSLADTDFAVPTRNVVEICRPAAATPLPNVPAWVLGVTNVRGDIVSLVDLGQFLGLPRGDDNQRARVLLARSGDTTTGLVVDRVAGIRGLAQPAPGADGVPGFDRGRPFVNGVADHEGRRVVVLDLDRMFQSPDMRQFDAA